MFLLAHKGGSMLLRLSADKNFLPREGVKFDTMAGWCDKVYRFVIQR